MMSFKAIASAALIIVSSTPAFAEAVIVTPNRVQAGDVVITQDRIVVPGVQIGTDRVAPAGAVSGLANEPIEAARGNDYTNADLTNFDFRAHNMQNAVFVNATLTNVNFENVDLRGANFTNADLQNANMNGANLEGANLTNATLSGTQMLDVNLHNAILTNVDMNQAVTGKRKPEQQPAITKATEIRDALTAPVGDKKIDLTINFDFNSDRLTDQGRAQVAEVAGALRAMKAPKIQIQGHTDNVGSDEYNQKLSQRRAAAVMYELMKIHQVFGKFEAMGYGEMNPIDTNDTDLGRARNRRVTLVNLSDTPSAKH